MPHAVRTEERAVLLDGRAEANHANPLTGPCFFDMLTA